MDPTVRELVLLALLSAFLCGVALIYAEPIATGVAGDVSRLRVCPLISGISWG